MKKRIGILWVLTILSFFMMNVKGWSQNIPSDTSYKHLTLLSKQIFMLPSTPEKINANTLFIKTLVKELKQPFSFNRKLDSLKTISILTAPDRSFRIFSWNLPYEDGSYRFYGAIQMNTADGKLKLVPLIDYAPLIKNTDTITNSKKWYGSQYYQMVTVQAKEKKYYVLLGWNGNTIESNKKVIEVLHFDEGKVVFGAPIIIDKQKKHNRIVFEFSKMASMYLKYDSKSNSIIFDHLVPVNGNESSKASYGPDLTFDAYEIKNGSLHLKENLDLKNSPTGHEDEYIFPDHKNRTFLKIKK